MDSAKRLTNSSPSHTPKRLKLFTECMYGEKCFRLNPHHLKEYTHSHVEDLARKQKPGEPVSLPNDYKSKHYLLDLDTLKAQIKSILDNDVLKLHDQSEKEKTSGETKNDDKKSSEENNKRTMSETASTSNNQSGSKEDQTASSMSSAPKKKLVLPDIRNFVPVVLPKGQFKRKLDKSAPYNIFYTTITDSPPTHNQDNSVTLQELLDPSLGQLKSSLQINFMIDIAWLVAHYTYAGYREKPMTVLYGDDQEDLKTVSRKLPNITARKIQMSSPFGTHHTKMMIFEYTDNSLRVVVSTANLYEDDWHNRTQGLWVSDLCPVLDKEFPTNDDGNGPTDFKKSLLAYLQSYNLPEAMQWYDKVKKCDFSHINVFLVTSVPGSHENVKFDNFGILRLSSLLSKHCVIPDNSGGPIQWSIIAQCSSIGSYGSKPEDWFYTQFRSCLSKCKNQGIASLPKMNLVYPSLENVRNSHDNMYGGGCLPYGKAVHDKQMWLEKYMCQWKATKTHRNRAMPHIKTYCRVSPDVSKLAWFHLTSANLSKSAWGNMPKSSLNPRLTIRSYEAGVLFLPKFVINKDVFCVKNLFDNGVESGDEVFPFPYDLPLTQYEKDDTAFVMDYLHAYMRKK